MKNRKASIVLVFFALAAMLIQACGGSDNSDATFTPSSPLASTPIPNTPAPAPTPPPTTSGDNTGGAATLQGVTGSISKNAGIKARAMATNNATAGRFVCLATYENPDGDIANQDLHDFECLEIQPGESHDFAVDLPQCAWQSDLFVGRDRPKEPPFYTPQELLAFREGGSGVCAPPPPPPPEGCQIDLECREDRNEDTVAISEERRFSKHLTCNVPVTFKSDADESEVSEQTFWGYWKIQAQDGTANVTATSRQSAKCSQSFSWRIPGDPCINARLEFDIDTETDDETTTVIVRVDSDTAGFVDFTQGQDTKREPFGPGVTVLRKTYSRDEITRNVFVTVVNECLQRSGKAEIPRIPTCEEQNPPSFDVTGPLRTRGEIACGNEGRTKKWVEFNGSVEFFNAGGSAKMLWGQVLKDEGSVEVKCGGSGTVELHRRWEGRCGIGLPSHWNSTFTIEVQQ